MEDRVQDINDVRIRPGDALEGRPYEPSRRHWPGVLAAVAIAAAVGLMAWRSGDDKLSSAVAPDNTPAATAPAATDAPPATPATSVGDAPAAASAP
jgi:ferric-dicitrate binding protein FerR (iron transport regulator)